MADAVYPLFKQELLKGTSNNLLNSAEGATGVYCALIDTGTYTYSAAHQFYSDLSGIVGTDQEILTKTQVNGTFDGTDITYTAVTGASVEALVLYRKNAGANTTWPLIVYRDASVSPTGLDISVIWHSGGIFTISDRRRKANIVEVGERNGVPVYEYTYRGSDRTRLGVMAQDVQKIKPAAVQDFGAFLAVDYDMALAA